MVTLVQRSSLILAACNLVVCLAGPASVLAQSTVNLPGLVASFKAASGQTVRRVDANCNLHWTELSDFDERLDSRHPLECTWAGALDVKVAGKYQLAISSNARVRLWVDEVELKPVDQQASSDLHSYPEQELTLGYHPLRIEYVGPRPETASSRSDHLQFYWRGPSFQWEPVGERFLTHGADQHPQDDFERGQLLVRGLRCTGCHRSAGDDLEPLPAPGLEQIGSNLDRDWLVGWLSDARPRLRDAGDLRDDLVAGRMPHLGLTPQDANDIATALLDASTAGNTFQPSRNFESKDKPKGKDKKAARSKPDAVEGRTALLTRGCMACHELSHESLGIRDEDDEANESAVARRDYLIYQLFGGGDLSAVASKRPQDFFSRWLARPDLVIPNHRMPQANLTDLEREDIALYLSSLHAADKVGPKFVQGNAERGLSLINRHRCAACHTLPKRLAGRAPDKLVLSAQSRWDAGCLGSPDAARSVPGYQLTQGQRRAIQVYWTSRATAVHDNPSAGKPTGRVNMLLAENNCLACHARHAHAGLAPRATQIINQERDLAPRLPAMLPPSLNSVGDKLTDDALASAISQSGPPHRPWLDVRMPKYPLDPSTIRAVVQHLVASDRLPTFEDGSGNTTRVPLSDDVVTRAAAARLVTSDGFGCQSCHKIGQQESPTVALGARGTDLTMLGKRIRQPWFDRWVRNPVRIVPRMEMPAIQLPVHGVLGNDLNRQLDAVWEMLNTPGFQPPSPAPVRVVRKRNLPDQPEAAHVLTDVLETAERNYLRPLMVGFQNRHNVLLDLERGELGKWWIGDTARELTRGKSWYWELGGQPLGAKLPALMRFQLIDTEGQLWVPRAVEQFVIDFDRLEHTGGRVSPRLANGSEPASGVQMQARMHFARDQRQLVVPLTVAMKPWQNEIDASRSSGQSGIELSFAFQLPDRYQVRILPGEDSLVWSETDQLPMLALDERTWLRVAQGGTLRDKVVETNRPSNSVNDPVEVTVWLLTTWPVDQFIDPATVAATNSDSLPARPAANSVVASPEPVPIKLVPGFTGVQLPLPRTEMPTALAWHNGQLVIGSLKGQVCLARDSNGDGLEDDWQAISDDMPAPYGLASNGSSIDVLAKYGLLRLHPAQAAGVPWSMEVVADGWGYTADYHDWAVGLVRDQDNHYLMALPCQQDDRSVSAARLRGTVQRLIPQTPTSHDPRRYRLETMAAGQRFPMGLALNRSGRLFATDNQGNYNPFNELNHIQTGKRYGFINKLESKPGFNPPLESPAVNLPHPWTRSVNGICFLDTPSTAGEAKAFGPFEGHLVGCEYNGLSLIRMSLEEVDGVVQGAAYMFSRPVQAGEANFEGPVVCAVSPTGELVIGNIHDSGWGGGQNTGSIVRLKPNGQWPLGIAEVQALPDGLRVVFTGQVDPTAASDVKSYTIRSYRRVSTPAYGGNDQEERQEEVLSASLVGNGTAVDLTLQPLRADSVYELRIGKLGSETLFPDEAHYTMKKVPSR